MMPSCWHHGIIGIVGAPELSLRIKPRDMAKLGAVHVRASLRLMAVLRNMPAQVTIGEMPKERLNRWNPNWRQSAPPREG